MLENLKLSFDQYRNRWLIGIVCGVLILGLVILASLNQTKPKSTAIASPAVELTWWKTDINPQVYQDTIQAFNQTPGNQNVRINIVTKETNNKYYRDLVEDLAQNIGPDIFSLANDDLPAYQKFLSPIDLFKGKELTDYKQNFAYLAVRETISKDKVYGITSYIDNLQLYYNKTILTQNQQASPPTKWEEISKQIDYFSKKVLGSDKFIQSTIALGTGGRSALGPTTSNIPLHPDILPLLMFQFGGQMYDYQTEENAMLKGENATRKPGISEQVIDENSPIYRAMRFYRDFGDSTTSRYNWNNNNIAADDMFAQGNLAYNIQYSSFANQVKKKNPRLEFSVTAIPQFNDQIKKTYGKFQMDSLNRKLINDSTASPTGKIKYQKAQEFLFYLSSKNAQTDFATKTGLPGAHNEVIKSQLNGDQQSRIFAAGSLYSDNYYKPDVTKVNLMWSKLFDRIQYENISLTESIQRASDEYDLILNDTPKIR